MGVMFTCYHPDGRLKEESVSAIQCAVCGAVGESDGAKLVCMACYRNEDSRAKDVAKRFVDLEEQRDHFVKLNTLKADRITELERLLYDERTLVGTNSERVVELELQVEDLKANLVKVQEYRNEQVRLNNVKAERIQELERTVQQLRGQEMLLRGFISMFQSRLEQSRQAILTAIADEDGLDGGTGDDLIVLIDHDLSKWQKHLDAENTKEKDNSC